MTKLTRRDFLVSTASVAAASTLGGSAHAATELNYKPEKDAKLRVLRWKRFVQGDEDLWTANTKKFTQQTGVEVRVDNEGWEDVRPKAAVAARSEEHTSELQSLMRISYAVFCLKKKQTD